MRPQFYHNRIQSRTTVNLGSLIPGLSLSRDFDYNLRQILPLIDGPVQGGDGSALSCEAVMTTSRKTPSNASANPAEPALPVSGVETRAERVERIRREIQAGTYETPEKLEAAIDRMMGILLD